MSRAEHIIHQRMGGPRGSRFFYVLMIFYDFRNSAIIRFFGVTGAPCGGPGPPGPPRELGGSISAIFHFLLFMAFHRFFIGVSRFLFKILVKTNEKPTKDHETYEKP